MVMLHCYLCLCVDNGDVCIWPEMRCYCYMESCSAHSHWLSVRCGQSLWPGERRREWLAGWLGRCIAASCRLSWNAKGTVHEYGHPPAYGVNTLKVAVTQYRSGHVCHLCTRQCRRAHPCLTVYLHISLCPSHATNKRNLSSRLYPLIGFEGWLGAGAAWWQANRNTSDGVLVFPGTCVWDTDRKAARFYYLWSVYLGYLPV